MHDKRRRILLLGSTGKLGQALTSAFSPDDEVMAHNSSSFDAFNFIQVTQLIGDCRPDLVINTVVFQGIDQCEREVDKALQLNTFFPKLLAERSVADGFKLVHFSTDSVFNNALPVPIPESATPCPLNIYGYTKYGGDCFVMNFARQYYLIRVSTLFGPNTRQNQFVERMLERIRNGERNLRISGDVIASPTFSIDVAKSVMNLVNQGSPFGLYHLANSGQASLYELISRLAAELGLDVTIERCSHADFPSLGRKNTLTPLRSEKIPPLRSWEEALAEYSAMIAKEFLEYV